MSPTPSFRVSLAQVASGEFVARLAVFLLAAATGRSLGLVALGSLSVAQGIIAYALVAGGGGLGTESIRRLASSGSIGNS